jgi:hypothetical protein
VPDLLILTQGTADTVYAEHAIEQLDRMLVSKRVWKPKKRLAVQVFSASIVSDTRWWKEMRYRATRALMLQEQPVVRVRLRIFLAVKRRVEI